MWGTIMTIGFLVFVVIFYFVVSYYNRKLKKENEQQNEVVIKKIKREWRKVTVNESAIDILETDRVIHLEDPGRYEDPIQHITSSTIYFYPILNGVKQKYVRAIDMDNTILEFKIRANGSIDLYFSDNDDSDFYVDLSFLDKEISFK